MIANSKILLLSVKFFDYEKVIANGLMSMGAKVDLFDERPSNTFLSKAIIRFKKSFYQRTIDLYFGKIIKKIKGNHYDYLLLIKGESTPLFFLEFLRKNNPGIKLIYYNYDSFKNNPNGLDNLVHFDRKFTFDKSDAEKYGLSFRPLFFGPDYARMHKSNALRSIYDVSFIGTAHSDRYSLSQKISEWCNTQHLNMYNFYFSPSKLLFSFRRLTDKNFSGFNSSKISFSSLTHGEIIEIYGKSNSILDINHPEQTGLTMRTFETLGSGRKLITTNADIKSYPFYNDRNILVIDRNDPKIDSVFFSRPFEPINNTLYNAMSLKGWLKELFENESNIWI